MASGNSSKNKIWTLYAYVVSSEYRKLIVKTLNVRPTMPKEISELINKPQSHVSRALRQLEDKGIIVCINPQNKKGRIYRLTELGVEIAKLLLEL